MSNEKNKPVNTPNQNSELSHRDTDISQLYSVRPNTKSPSERPNIFDTKPKPKPKPKIDQNE